MYFPQTCNFLLFKSGEDLQLSRIQKRSIISISSPLLTNFGKLIEKFFRNFSFPGHELDRFLGNSSINFLSFCKMLSIKFL